MGRLLRTFQAIPCRRVRRWAQWCSGRTAVGRCSGGSCCSGGSASIRWRRCLGRRLAHRRFRRRRKQTRPPRWLILPTGPVCPRARRQRCVGTRSQWTSQQGAVRTRGRRRKLLGLTSASAGTIALATITTLRRGRPGAAHHHGGGRRHTPSRGGRCRRSSGSGRWRAVCHHARRCWFALATLIWQLSHRRVATTRVGQCRGHHRHLYWRRSRRRRRRRLVRRPQARR